MISLKKYLDMDTTTGSGGERESSEPLSATMESYLSALRAIGKSAVQSCPSVGSDLEQGLASLVSHLSSHPTAKVVKQTEEQVEDQLQKWGVRTAKHFQAKADEVKELLLVLARTAESVGERDDRYAHQFTELTTRLRTIANLDDLTQIRSSLVQSATELKNCVDQMTHDSRRSASQLRAEVSNYEAKLKAAEQLALKDTLTGLANRRCVEGRMERYIAQQQTFCVALLDLNRFKRVNDAHGHAAGDDLLKKFSRELHTNVRSSDLVGRWGGDEFIALLECNLAGAKSHIERIQKWVLGDYTIEVGGGKAPQKVHVDASIGLAQWQPGETIQAVVQQADTAMYEDKRESRKRKP